MEKKEDSKKILGFATEDLEKKGSSFYEVVGIVQKYGKTLSFEDFKVIVSQALNKVYQLGIDKGAKEGEK